MGLPANIRFFHSGHYRISSAARSKTPRTANKRGTSGREGTGTNNNRYAHHFPFRGYSRFFRARLAVSVVASTALGIHSRRRAHSSKLPVLYWVFRENSYGASTIQIVEDQKVISTGPYAMVRHP